MAYAVTVARYDPHGLDGSRSWVALMSPAIELAKAVASTEFVPRGMRNNPAAISAAILYGDEVGLGPMQSLAKIAVIEGRPFMAAESQRALVLAAGHDLWIDELTATRCTWAGRRAGADQVTRITWTLDDARRAGISGKQNWRAYPRQMLSARASAELVRAVFADVVGGIAALEEFDDLDGLESDGVVADSVGGNPPAAGAKRRRRRTTVTAGVSRGVGVSPLPDEGRREDLPPLPDEGEALDLDALGERDLEAESVPMSTRAQRDRMHGLMKRRGINDRDERLALTAEVIGRNVPTSTSLTAAEADVLLDYLESAPAVEVEPDDEGGTA